MTAHCCVVVADRNRARVFLVRDGDGGRQRLVEEGDLANGAHEEGDAGRHARRPAGPDRSELHRQVQHQLALEHTFAKEVAARTAAIVQGWQDGEVMLVAPSHMLGQLREVVRKNLPSRLALRELAREYTNLTPAQLARQLGMSARKTGEAR